MNKGNVVYIQKRFASHLIYDVPVYRYEKCDVIDFDEMRKRDVVNRIKAILEVSKSRNINSAKLFLATGLVLIDIRESERLVREAEDELIGKG